MQNGGTVWKDGPTCMQCATSASLVIVRISHPEFFVIALGLIFENPRKRDLESPQTLWQCDDVAQEGRSITIGK